MDWRDAPRWKDKMVVYTDARGEEHLYILRDRRKDRQGRIFALIQDMRCKNSFMRVAFKRLTPCEPVAVVEEENEQA